MSTVQVNRITNLDGNSPVTVDNLYQYVSFIEDIRSGDATRVARGLNGLGLKYGAIQTPGAANGVATLDANGRLTGSQLPDTNVGRPGDILFAPTAPTNGTWVKADGSIYSKSVYPDAANNIGPYMDFRNPVATNLPTAAFASMVANDGSITSVGWVNGTQGNIFVYRSTDGGATFTAYNTGISFYNNQSYAGYNNLAYNNGVWLLQITGLPSSGAGTAGTYLYKSTNLTTWTTFAVPSGFNNANIQYVLGAVGNLFNLIPIYGTSGYTYWTTDGTAAWSNANDAAFRSAGIDTKAYGHLVYYANGVQFLLPGFSVQPIIYTTDGKTWKFTTQTLSYATGIIFFKNSYIVKTNGSQYVLLSADMSTFTYKDMLGPYKNSLFPEHYISTSPFAGVISLFSLFNKYLFAYVSYFTYNGQQQQKTAIVYTEDMIEWKVLFKCPYVAGGGYAGYDLYMTTNNGTRLTSGRYTLSLTYDPSSQFQVPFVINNEMGMNVYPWIKLK